MAIYRLHLKHITRSRGLSAQAHARYITRNDNRSVSPTAQQALDKERSASAHAAYLDRSTTAHAGAYRDDLVYVEHGNMPAWAQESPQEFWNAADRYERTNGRLYSEMEVAIPRELASQDRVALARAFVQSALGNRHPYSCAIHNSTALDGGEQPHAHIMFSERRLDGLERSPAHFFASKWLRVFLLGPLPARTDNTTQRWSRASPNVESFLRAACSGGTHAGGQRLPP